MKAFNVESHYDYFGKVAQQLQSDHGQIKEYILGVDEASYREYLFDKYSFEQLIVDFDKEELAEPIKKQEIRDDHVFRESYQIDVYYLTISHPFTGSPEIFRIRPSRRIMTSYDIIVNEIRRRVSYTVSVDKQDADEFRRLKGKAREAAFANLDNANFEVTIWNNNLASLIERIFSERKSLFLKENDFYAALNLTVNKSADGLFTVPVIKKKTMPKPQLDNKQRFAVNPILSDETYSHILELIYNVGQNMERKPALYKAKDENGLRDFFLSQLEFRYEGVTATGETFNAEGKTDICLKYAADGTNLFIAECKFWTGFADFLKAISQLFDRYLTWRDSKVAVLMFVKNLDFTAVLDNIRADIKNHPYYVRSDGQRGESSFSYIFHLPQDVQKHVQLEIIAFHFHKN